MNLKLRPIKKQDAVPISKSFQNQGWDKPIEQYTRYFEYQETGLRDVILAEIDGAFAGYLTIKWESDYLSFREQKIPEIVDFNVLKKYQRLGIGTLLMEEAEKRISIKSKYAGIGFGVYQDYGAAQILYIKRGYIPDGNGLVRDSRSLEIGEEVTIDDGLVFFLKKKL